MDISMINPVCPSIVPRGHLSFYSYDCCDHFDDQIMTTVMLIYAKKYIISTSKSYGGDDPGDL